MTGALRPRRSASAIDDLVGRYWSADSAEIHGHNQDCRSVQGFKTTVHKSTNKPQGNTTGSSDQAWSEIERTVQASSVSSVSAGASAVGMVSVFVGASTAISSPPSSGPSINPSASLELGNQMRVTTCPWAGHSLPVSGFDGDLLFNKFAAFLEDEMASCRLCSVAG